MSHILVILALHGEAATPPQSASAVPLLCSIVGAAVLAAVWSRFLRRGPLEHLLHNATGLVHSVR